MKLQYKSGARYVSNRKFTPVRKWNTARFRYYVKEIQHPSEIPQWQKDIVLERLKAYEHGAEDYLELENARKEIVKGL